MKAYLGSGGIAPHILDLGARWRWVVRFMPRPLIHRLEYIWKYILQRRCVKVWPGLEEILSVFFCKPSAFIWAGSFLITLLTRPTNFQKLSYSRESFVFRWS
jgi:hypothetical protein